MKTALIGFCALISCMLNAELPMANGTYAGVGYATSTHGLDNPEYQSTFTVEDTSITAVFSDDNARSAHITYTMTPMGEDFYKLDVFLKYQSNLDVIMEWQGSGIGNCHVGICHFNSEIKNISDEITSVKISDLFGLEGASDLQRKIAVDIFTTDPAHTMSYALVEQVTLVTDSME